MLQTSPARSGTKHRPQTYFRAFLQSRTLKGRSVDYYFCSLFCEV